MQLTPPRSPSALRPPPPSATSRVTFPETFLWLLLLMAAALPGARAVAAEVPNPEYAKWAALAEGSWVRVRITGDLRRADWKYTLVKVTPEAVVLRVTETRYDGKPADKPREERVSSTLARALPAPDVAGDEELKVGEVTLKCRREVRRASRDAARKDAGGGTEVTTWVSDDVPGFVKRVTLLAADARVGLPEGKTIEAVVGYELKPRGEAQAHGAGGDADEPAGERQADGARAKGAGPGEGEVAQAEGAKDAGPAVRRAGELGPSRFEWTYTFDPPGWRKWERVSETEWVERWESGEVQQFEIVRHVDDGERVGTVVTRLPDRGIETVIPDAGKGATLWFRTLPDGEWVSLGELEESE